MDRARIDRESKRYKAMHACIYTKSIYTYIYSLVYLLECVKLAMKFADAAVIYIYIFNEEFNDNSKRRDSKAEMKRKAT